MMADTQECSFCGKEKDQVKKLIVGDSSAICSECVDFCQQLLVEDQGNYAGVIHIHDLIKEGII